MPITGQVRPDLIVPPAFEDTAVIAICHYLLRRSQQPPPPSGPGKRRLYLPRKGNPQQEGWVDFGLGLKGQPIRIKTED